MGAYLLWTGANSPRPGFLAFDVTPNIMATWMVTATDSPVERGPNVSDHIRQELDTATIDVFVSNAPLHGGNHINPNAKRGDFEGITLDIPHFKGPINTLGKLLGAAIDKLFGTDKPPTRALLLQFDREFDAVQETLDALRKLQGEGQLVEVITPHWTCPSMIVTNVRPAKQAADGTGSRISIDLKQIRIVETKRTLAPIPSEPRAKAIVKGGFAGYGEGGDYQTRLKDKSLLKGLTG